MKNIQYILCSIVIAIVYVLHTLTDKNSILLPEICVFFVVSLYAYQFYMQQHSVFKSLWCRPSNIFLLAFFAVSFQYIFDLILGLKRYSDFYMPHTVNTVAAMCTIGLAAFVMGYNSTNSGNTKQSDFHHIHIRIGLLVALQLLFFVAWIATVDILSLMIGENYFEDATGTAESNYEMLFYDTTLAILTGIVLNLREKEKVSFMDFLKSNSIFSWVVIGLYSGIRLVSGDRGPFMYTLLAVFFAYLMLSKAKVRVLQLLVLGIVATFVINVVGMARSASLDKSFTERVTESITDFTHNSDARFSERTILPLTEELAMSSRCNQIAVDFINYKNEPYHNGMYTFYQVIQCVPFVPSYLVNSLKITDDERSTNLKMTDVVYGTHEFTQIGTTVTTDPYFDFGFIGVIIMLFIVGIIYKKVDYSVYIKSPSNWFFIAIVLLIASKAIYIPRSTLVGQFKELIPICAIFYLNKLLFANKCQKK